MQPFQISRHLMIPRASRRFRVETPPPTDLLCLIVSQQPFSNVGLRCGEQNLLREVSRCYIHDGVVGVVR